MKGTNGDIARTSDLRVRVDEATAQRLAERAKANERSVAAEIRFAIREHLLKPPARRRRRAPRDE